MNDNVIQFPVRDDSKGQHRRVPIMFNAASQKALEERVAAEGTTETEIVNRAVQVYAGVQTLIDHLEYSERMSGIFTDNNGVRFRIMVEIPD